VKNPNGASSPPDSDSPDRPWREWLVAGGIFAPVVIIALVVVASSYYHEYELAWHNGQPGWVAKALPFTVDGLVLAAGIAILWALANGIRRPWRPLAALAVGALATLSANLFSALSYWWLRPAVSVWAGVAALLVGDIGMWWISERRKLADPDSVPAAPACSCPPPPVTLAEALPRARAELRDRGEKNGEPELADRFEVTRYKVRAVLSATVPQTPAAAAGGPSPSPRGDGKLPRPVRPPAGTDAPSQADTVPAGPSLAASNGRHGG
jgi:hypothetical protein